MNSKELAFEPQDFVQLSGQDRVEAMEVFKDLIQKREDAEKQIFVPRQLHISEVKEIKHDKNARSLVMTLKDGKVISYSPKAPGLLKFFQGKGYIRAMTPIKVQMMDDVAHVLVERRMWLLDRLFKNLLVKFFPNLAFKPKSLMEVYKVKRELFHFLYEELRNEM